MNQEQVHYQNPWLDLTLDGREVPKTSSKRKPKVRNTLKKPASSYGRSNFNYDFNQKKEPA
jgi:hypothetical protein